MIHLTHALTDGALLGLFMLSASTFGVLLFHPDLLARRIRGVLARRVLMGLAMGATSALLVYSPAGRYSGAHMNPAVTLAFLTLGKVALPDAALYVLAQCAGAVLGMLASRAMLGPWLAHEGVNFVTTRPGPAGWKRAAWVELLISFVLFLVVLLANNAPRTHSLTGLLAGSLVTLWIVVAAPASGMSMNPARSLASALVARRWDAIWIYVLVPPLAMQGAGQTYLALDRRVFCARMHHAGATLCPFRCEFADLAGSCDSCERAGQLIDGASRDEPDQPHSGNPTHGP